MTLELTELELSILKALVESAVVRKTVEIDVWDRNELVQRRIAEIDAKYPNCAQGYDYNEVQYDKETEQLQNEVLAAALELTKKLAVAWERR